MKAMRTLRVIPLALASAFLLYPRSPPPLPEATGAGNEAALASDEWIVDFRDDADPAAIRALASRLGVALHPNSILEPSDHILRGTVPAAARAQLAADPLVEAVEPDFRVTLDDADLDEDPMPAEYAAPPRPAEPPDQPRTTFPRDPKFAHQWHLSQMHAPEAWKHAAGAGVVVAVIDTGVAYEDHGGFKRAADLAADRLVPGYDFVGDTEHANDDHGHGTHVAGTIAQATDNGVGVSGIAYQARIMPLKVLSAAGSGNVADISEAIRFAADKGARVINLSLGGSMSSKVMEKAVAYAIKKGVTVVAAAGNSGQKSVGYPAGYPGVVAVAATQFDESLAFYSNRGPRITLAAPGGNTRVDQNGDGFPDGVLQNTLLPGSTSEDGYLYYMGTSMASPHVAGVAALIIGAGTTEPAAVRRVLVESARKPKIDCGGMCGAGLLDADAAVRAAALAFPVERTLYALAFGLALFGLGALRVGILGGAAIGALGVPLVAGGSVLGLGASPLLLGILLPVVLAGLLWGVRRLRPWLGGFAAGVAAACAFSLVAPVTQVAGLSLLPGLSTLWLLGSALGSAALARAVLRRR